MSVSTSKLRCVLVWLRAIGIMLLILNLPIKTAYAAQNCSPRSIAQRAVGGEMLNQLLGSYNQIAGALGGVNNFISPTPSSLMADCILPRLPPFDPPPPDGPQDPSPVRPPAGGWGDPHLITHDGLGYDFQGAGDYMYVAGSGVEVQARHFRLSVNALPSRIKAFAIRFDDTTVVINDPIDSALIGSEPGILDVITVDGNDYPIGLGGWIDLDEQGSFIIRLRSHTFLNVEGKLRLLVTNSGNAFKLYLDDSLRESVTGALGDFDGNPDNDLKTVTGTLFSINDTETLYGDFLDSWIRQGSESLFNSAYDPAVDGSIVPVDTQLLSSVRLPVREAAAQRCRDAGVAPGYTLHGCIYDMVFEEDEQWLSDAAEASTDGLSLVPATAIAAPDNTTIVLEDLASVSAMAPSDDAGNLSSISDIDAYSLGVEPGSLRILQPASPCSVAQPFSLLIRSDNGVASEHSLTCGAAIPLPVGQLTLSVFSHGGDIGDYSFTIAEPATTDLGLVTFDTLVDGTLNPSERVVATLPVQSGGRAFVTSNQTLNCGQRWELIDGDGRVVQSTSICLDIGLFIAEGNIPYRLQIQQSSSSTFGFTVVDVGEDTTVEVGADRQLELAIASPGQQASATFSLLQGERIYVDRQGGVLSGALTVTAPDSSVVVASVANEEDVQFVASTAGEYTLTLSPSDDFTGVVPVTLVQVADDVVIDVNRGDTFTLTLSTFGQRAAALFNVAAGDVFTVTATRTVLNSGNAVLPFIKQPDGEQILVLFGTRTVTAPQSGRYEVVIESKNGNEFTGSYEISID